MAFWSSEKLKSEAGRYPDLITPYDDKKVKHGAYELRLGKCFYITSDSVKKKGELGAGYQMCIPPGQMAILINQEQINIPNRAVALPGKNRSIDNMSLYTWRFCHLFH